MNTLKQIRNVAGIAVVALGVTGCHKTPNTAPPEDKDLQTSITVSHANLVISDIDMICSYVGENDLYPKFYEAGPGQTAPTVIRNPSQNNLFIGFNNTKCMDGRVRSGTIIMNYGFTNPNAKYCRDYQFEGKVSLSGYKVDGWNVGLNNTFYITNKLSSPAYDPKTTNLTWEIKGDFTLNDPADPSKNIHCNVDLIKTLMNTADPLVFAPSKQSAISWSLAVVEYQGKVYGETNGNVPFTYVVDAKNPLVRDFTCYPDKVAGVTTTPSLTVNFNEFHPFVNGVASFTTGNLYPRIIDYGNEQGPFDNSKTSSIILMQQCDNKGIVVIKGISYAVNFEE